MLKNILIIVAYLFESCIWVYSMGLRFERKYDLKRMYISYITMSLAISLIGQFSSLSIDTLFTILEFATTSLFICICFMGKTVKKILHVGILFIISLICDLIVFICMTASGISSELLASDGVENAIATLLSKCVACFIIRILYKRVRLETVYAPLIFLTIVLELPSIVMFRTMKEKPSYLVLYIISQLAAVGLVSYIIKFVKNKTSETEKVFVKVANLEQQAEEYRRKAEEYKLKAEELERDALELECSVTIDTPETIEVTENRKKRNIHTSEIISCERVGRKINITTIDDTIEINSTITRLEEELGVCFWKINQGTLVNRNYIDKVEGGLLTLTSGAVLHISRERSKALERM